MAERSFEHDIFIEAAPEVVYNFLAVQTNHQKIHPLIVSITPLPDEPDKPDTKYYQVIDQLAMGPFNWKIKYKAAVTPLNSNELKLEAFQPFLYLQNLTRCVAEAGGTHLFEFVRVKTPAILMGYAFGQARSSHREMFLALKKLLGEPKRSSWAEYP